MKLTLEQIVACYYITVCGILVLIETATVAKLARGTGNRGCTIIIAMLVVANIAIIVYKLSYLYIFTAKNKVPWIWTRTVSIYLFYSFFNVSHWLFSFEYYNMVRVITYTLEDK